MTAENTRRWNARRKRLGRAPLNEDPSRLAWANVGQHHPDYGLTQPEHLAAKERRS